MRQGAYIKIMTRCVLIFLFSTAMALAAPVSINGMRIAQEENNTRLVFETNGTVVFKSFQLHQPERLVIDLGHTDIKTSLNDAALNQTPIQKIRTGADKQNNIRMVMDLKNAVTAHVFTLPASNQYGPRLVVDLVPAMATANSSESSKATNNTENTNPNAQKSQNLPLPHVAELSNIKPPAPPAGKTTLFNKIPSPLPLVPQISLQAKPKNVRDVIVVIDAGHGGHDAGAIGSNGTHEKDVVLGIAKALARQISDQTGMRAVLTRDDDTFIPLRERLRLARKGNADMFLAIHADAYKSPYSAGASVFALSRKGASSEAARWLAEKENYSELGGTTVADKNPLLFSVLLDLSQTGTIRESLKLGSDMLQEIGKMTRLHHNYVEQAPFVVLKSPDIPSLLIETGFISNPNEESKLKDPDYQNKLARAMLVGIRQYFILNPPPDSYFALHQQSAATHIVQAGETLASIAKKYKVDLRGLEKMNRLSHQSLELGQVIYLPNNNIRS